MHFENKQSKVFYILNYTTQKIKNKRATLKSFTQDCPVLKSTGPAAASA